MTKADIVRNFITKNPAFKDKKEIARQILKKYPDLFNNLEHARTTVRTVTGSHGDISREVKDPEKIKFFFNGFEKWSQENLNTEVRPFDEPFVIPSSIKTLNCIADIHSVHLDHRVMTKFLKTTKDKEAILINGDLIDSESLSRHLKGHNVIEYHNELESCHHILKGLKEEFNHVYFKEGNHDFWLERYLLNNAREVFRLIGVNLKELLKCGELGVHHIHNLKYVQYGDLDIVHGHEFPGYGAKFPSVSLAGKWQNFKKKADVKVIQAHSHQECQTITRKSVDGKFGQAWAMAAMCKKAASYAPFAGKENGWAEFKINEDGFTDVKLIRA